MSNNLHPLVSDQTLLSPGRGFAVGVALDVAHAVTALATPPDPSQWRIELI